MTNPTIKTYK